MSTPLPSETLRRELGIMTEGELANALGITASTLEVWRGQGKGPVPTKLGKGVFYTDEDVRVWVVENRLERFDKDDSQSDPTGTALK